MLDNWIPDASGWFPIEGANILDFSDNAFEVDLWCDHPVGGFRFCNAFHDGDGVWRDRFDKLEDCAPGSRPTHFRYTPGSPGEPVNRPTHGIPQPMINAAQDVLAMIVDPTEEGAEALIIEALQAARVTRQALETPYFDLVDVMQRHHAASLKANGPDRDAEWTCGFITKELDRARKQAPSLSAWTSIALIALDAALRAGHPAVGICDALLAHADWDEDNGGDRFDG